jgi:hypothetical protein
MYVCPSKKKSFKPYGLFIASRGGRLRTYKVFHRNTPARFFFHRAFSEVFEACQTQLGSAGRTCAGQAREAVFHSTSNLHAQEVRNLF